MIKNNKDRIEYRNENDQLHRIDGPAVTFKKYNRHFFYINGVPVDLYALREYQRSLFAIKENENV